MQEEILGERKQRARVHLNTIQSKPMPIAGCNAACQRDGGCPNKYRLRDGNELHRSWHPSVIASASWRSASQFHKLGCRRTCRQPKSPHSCTKRDPRAPVRIVCINVSAMPSISRAQRRYVAAGSLRPIRSMSRIAKFLTKNADGMRAGKKFERGRGWQQQSWGADEH